MFCWSLQGRIARQLANSRVLTSLERCRAYIAAENDYWKKTTAIAATCGSWAGASDRKLIRPEGFRAHRCRYAFPCADTFFKTGSITPSERSGQLSCLPILKQRRDGSSTPVPNGMRNTGVSVFSLSQINLPAMCVAPTLSVWLSVAQVASKNNGCLHRNHRISVGFQASISKRQYLFSCPDGRFCAPASRSVPEGENRDPFRPKSAVAPAFAQGRKSPVPVSCPVRD